MVRRRRKMSRSLTDLHPEVRAMVDGFLADLTAAGIDYIVTCTRRSEAEQEALYAQGRTAPGPKVTNAKPGHSAHNYGFAIDIVPIVNGKPDWNATDPIWEQMGKLGQARGLQWFGAPDSPYIESCHFQAPNWRDL